MHRRIAPRITSLVALIAFTLEACVPPPPVMVHAGRIGQRADEELGTVVPFERFPEPPRAHVKEGFTAIRNLDDWDLVFADVPKKERPNAPSFDFDKYMMVLAYTSAEEVDKLRVRNMIESHSGIHVYMTETLRGKGCAPKKGAPKGALEIASFPKTERVVHVHLDIEEGDSCDVEQIQGELQCKVVGSGSAVTRLTAAVGQKVDCTAGTNADGVYDRNWTFVHLPKGSATKLTILPEAMHVVFPIDVLGNYELSLELANADKRAAIFRGTVEVPPPTDQLYTELFWSKFDAMDDPNTFPRVELRSQELIDEGGKPVVDAKGKPVLDKKKVPVLTKEKLGKPCVLGWEKVSTCNVEKTGANTLMRLSGGTGRFKMSVRYVDERFDGMPVLCIRTYSKAKESGEECDPTPRKAGDVWDVGIVSESEGGFEEEESAKEGGAASSSGGAANGSDAGIKEGAENSGATSRESSSRDGKARPDGGW